MNSRSKITECWDYKRVATFLVCSYHPKEETKVLKGKVVQGSRGCGSRTQTQKAWEISALSLSCLYLSLTRLVQSGLEMARGPQKNDAVFSHTLTTLTTFGGFLGIPSPRSSGSHRQLSRFPQNQTCFPFRDRLTSQHRQNTS